jgi:hypothetical protein
MRPVALLVTMAGEVDHIIETGALIVRCRMAGRPDAYITGSIRGNGLLPDRAIIIGTESA